MHKQCKFELLDSSGHHSGVVHHQNSFASFSQSWKGPVRLIARKTKVLQRQSEWKDFPWQHLVAGAAGGAVSRTATAPLELLRLQAMTTSGKVQSEGGVAAQQQRPNLVRALKVATEGQGWQGLWRGNGLNVLRAGPQKAIDFFSFELYKGWIGQRIGHGPATVLSSAALAGATSTAILHPLEVVRSRMTCDQAGQYSHGVGAAFSRIVKKEGPLKLYTGLGPSMVAMIPEAAISYGCFDLLTTAYMRSTKKEKAGVGIAAAAGIVSCVLGSSISFPLETVARRLQVGSASGASATVSQVVQQVLQEGGVAGFYRGYGVGVLRAVPTSALSFGTYELVRAWLAVQNGAAPSTTSR
ncbi:hypothetical protein ABBQ38_009975 [Trebouxia sp. C0009 RCD-2024]